MINCVLAEGVKCIVVGLISKDQDLCMCTCHRCVSSYQKKKDQQVCKISKINILLYVN